MKNVLELPTKNDFFSVMILDLSKATNGYFFEKDVVKKNEGSINLRSIIDFHSFNTTIDVLDEEKYPEFDEKQRAFREQVQKHRMENDPHGAPVVYATPPQDELPLRECSITGTIVYYYTGMCRVIDMPLVDFEEQYFNFLQREKLDINN